MKLARVASITAVLLEEGLGFLTHKDTDSDDAKPDVPEDEQARRLRQTLERLGPTFVKFGQLLATRVDLFSETFCHELGKLHAEVAPFDAAEARRIVETELDRPIDELFSSFSEQPVASASIAQVHKAQLASDGTWVALKVQRPGLEDSLLQDLDALIVLSSFIDRLVPRYHRSMVHRVAQEYALRAKGEMDFLAEARAMEQFSDVLSTVPGFRVPTLYPSLSTPKLLVMEWIEGPKLADMNGPTDLAALGFDPDQFARAMLRLQISMAYEHGLVHGDTHPGNILLAPDGQIVLIDFGLHGHVPRALREKVLEAIFYQASGQVDEAVQATLQVLDPDDTVDVTALKADLTAVMKDGLKEDADPRITANLIASLRVGSSYQLRAQSDLFMVVRNLAIVEGIVLRYGPDVDMLAETKQITGGILRRKLFGPTMQEDMMQLLPQLALTLSQRPRLVSRLMKLERSFNEAKSLGEFLRREDVIRAEPPPASPVNVWTLVALVVGLLIGLAIHS